MGRVRSGVGYTVASIFAIAGVLMIVSAFSPRSPASTVTTHQTGKTQQNAAPSRSTPTPAPTTPESGSKDKGSFTPVSLSIPAAGVINAPVYPYTDAMVAATPGHAIVPNTLEDVAWWTGGGFPGATPSNTVPPKPGDERYAASYYGHSWCLPASDPSYCKPAVFDNLKMFLNSAQGGTATIKTADGTQYVYTITDAFPVNKTSLSDDAAATVDLPGIIHIYTCYRTTQPDQDATTQNVVTIWKQIEVIPPPTPIELEKLLKSAS